MDGCEPQYLAQFWAHVKYFRNLNFLLLPPFLLPLIGTFSLEKRKTIWKKTVHFSMFKPKYD